jgi:hypothetical protein
LRLHRATVSILFRTLLPGKIAEIFKNQGG